MGAVGRPVGREENRPEGGAGGRAAAGGSLGQAASLVKMCV
jgi:hypothetical protein